MKILVVEDDPPLRRSLTATLESEGHEAVCAETGEAALALALPGDFDAMILDIGLPDIDGFDLGRRIRANARLSEVRLIAMTGFSENAHREEAAEAGFDAYLVKPVSRNKLAATLAEVTNRPEHSSSG